MSHHFQVGFLTREQTNMRVLDKRKKMMQSERKSQKREEGMALLGLFKES